MGIEFQPYNETPKQPIFSKRWKFMNIKKIDIYFKIFQLYKII
jgi:hypothetical protein